MNLFSISSRTWELIDHSRNRFSNDFQILGASVQAQNSLFQCHHPMWTPLISRNYHYYCYYFMKRRLLYWVWTLKYSKYNANARAYRKLYYGRTPFFWRTATAWSYSRALPCCSSKTHYVMTSYWNYSKLNATIWSYSGVKRYKVSCVHNYSSS